MLNSTRLKKLVKAQASLHRIESAALAAAQVAHEAAAQRRRELIYNMSGENPNLSAALAAATGSAARAWTDLAGTQHNLAMRAQAAGREGVLLRQLERVYQSRVVEEQREAASRELAELVDKVGSNHNSRVTQA
jgi:hypothetical protein